MNSILLLYPLGVLRGQKSRFQLFGDSVNTAARMESNGAPGRIHISQATADELIKAGKSQWITSREGAISVKGKGDMQTYFVNFGAMSQVTKSTKSSDVTVLTSSTPPGSARKNEDDYDAGDDEHIGEYSSCRNEDA